MTDSILIVGGGIAGLTAAMECVRAGARAIVVEEGPVVGGRLAAAMTEQADASEEVGGLAIPKFDTLAQAEGIEIITLAALEAMRGRPGNFEVSIVERARFVTDACTRCGRCSAVCPSVSANEYQAGLTHRKAIYTPLPQTLPQEYVIDIASCLNEPPNYLPCNRCIEVCDDDAIRFDLPLERRHERQVGAVILAVGFEFDNRTPAQIGYGVHPDVVTMEELQGLLTAPGPTGGYAAKPSDEEYPCSVMLILDEPTPFWAATAASQIRQLVDQDIERVVLLLTTQQDAARPSEFLQALPPAVEVNHGLLQSIEAGPDQGVTVSWADFSGSRIPSAQFDIVALWADVRPASGLERLADAVGVDLDEAGYPARPEAGEAVATGRAGVYAAGGTRGPATLRAAVEGALGAAASALGHLDHRLLNDDYAPAAPGEGDEALSDEELRARIERALAAMIYSKP